MKGFRSAGSVFMNPGDAFAGQMIEQAGLKGLRIGGARVFERHANVIVTQEGACTSDVMALMERIRGEVGRRFGVELRNEVVVLG
jgi:UDP-N-acetylmuramate dehydrogenase